MVRSSVVFGKSRDTNPSLRRGLRADGGEHTRRGRVHSLLLHGAPFRTRGTDSRGGWFPSGWKDRGHGSLRGLRRPGRRPSRQGLVFFFPPARRRPWAWLVVRSSVGVDWWSVLLRVLGAPRPSSGSHPKAEVFPKIRVEFWPPGIPPWTWQVTTAAPALRSWLEALLRFLRFLRFLWTLGRSPL